ncbi:MAG: hypothetical protein IJX81_00135 [Clostridia bacterium]|nr:hypothetical protein [Clostridia bacterium]
MKKSAYYSDLLFAFLAPAVLLLCYLRYLRVPLFPAALVAILAGGAIALLLSFFLKRKRDAVFLKRTETEEAEKLALHLCMLSKKELAVFFADALFGDGNVFVKNGECFAFFGGELILLQFSPDPLTAERVLPLLKESAESPVLYCRALNSEAESFCARFGVSVKTAPAVYALLKKQGKLPNAYRSERAFQKKKRLSLSLRFSKRFASRFFASGVFLLLFSLFVPFPYYYLLFGGILLTASLFVRVFGHA